MGRQGFEDQIKDKLSEREIKPSSGSWEKLSGQLNSEEKKQSPIFWWIGIAATLLGAILIAGMVYNNNPATETPGLVEAPVEVELGDKKEQIIEESIAAEENIVLVPPKKTIPSTPNKETKQVKKLPEKILIAQVKKEDLPVNNENVNAQTDEKISRKIEEIIAEVSLKDGGAGNPTNNEIDALLYMAASEISFERRNINSIGTVDAEGLLFAVEMELEESFRDKVFDILKESYLKARTAVANRNY